MRSQLLMVTALALAGCVKNDPPPPPLSMSGGAAVAAGGSGGVAGTGGAPVAGDPSVCEPANSALTPQQLHAQALDVLGTMGMNPQTGVVGACSFGSCHVAPRPRGMLQLNGVPNLMTALVGHPSCEAPTIPLVAPGGGNAALQGSWLWLKMVAPVNPASGALMPNPAWGAGNVTACGDILPSTPFGVRMPKGGDASVLLNENRLGPIRRWICAGAPGP